jgi:hypothetical protein
MPARGAFLLIWLSRKLLNIQTFVLWLAASAAQKKDNKEEKPSFGKSK